MRPCCSSIFMTSSPLTPIPTAANRGAHESLAKKLSWRILGPVVCNDKPGRHVAYQVCLGVIWGYACVLTGVCLGVSSSSPSRNFFSPKNGVTFSEAERFSGGGSGEDTSLL
ncbi:hypothetical protein CEXT_84551 [Caerostris extrusa]|uniref:Uncharacterized protein n=1 Tax=Caerostris extrusa TaxID=172846 RepID=A0AAV4NIW3_CAEEX|nr:hypothetical protein CEXT_84551 [Caerostris extrusa]